MKKAIQHLLQGHAFSRQDMQALMHRWVEAPVEQQVAVLTLLAAKEESVEEILGAREALFAYSTPLITPYDPVDIVGTGGDGSGTFNVSTTASLVLASCGVYVAKHGGKSTTSQVGSTDVLEHLGLSMSLNEKSVNDSLRIHRYAYLWAPLFNTAFKNAGALRKQLGVSTLINILGPIMNPIQPKKLVLGVNRRALMPKMTKVLQQLDLTHALVVHGADGLDEFSISAPTYYVEIKNGVTREGVLLPEEVGLKRAPLTSVLGADVKENARIMQGLLFGDITGPQLDIVLLNAGAGLVVAGHVKDIREGVQLAREAVATKQTKIWFELFSTPPQTPEVAGA